MEIPSNNPPAIKADALNSSNSPASREGELLLKGLLANQIIGPQGRSLWVELLRHVTLPQAEKNLLTQAQPTKTPVLPSWQQILTDAPIELIELKLPSGQKIWAATLKNWFDSVLSKLPANSPIEIKTTKDGQLIFQNPAPAQSSIQVALPNVWRKYLPMAQSSKELMQLMTPLLKPLGDLTGKVQHPLQPIHQFISQQSKAVAVILAATQQPSAKIDKANLSQSVAQIVSNSGIFFEGKLRNTLVGDGQIPKEPLEQIVASDFKASILKSMAAINSFTPDTVPDEDQWPEHLWRLFLGVKDPAVSGQQKQQQFLLLEALLPSLTKTLAGIQLQQAQSLAEQEKAPGTLHLELPLPSSEGWLNLSAQLTPLHAKIDPEADGGTDNNRTSGSWRLHLEFNLPNNGLLAVQFLWQPGLLRGRVWANQPRLKKQLDEQLRELKKSLLEGGINAEQLLISEEPIEKTPLPIHQPLVDIKT